MTANLQRTDKFLDNTMISSYKECPRLYFLRHTMGWRGEGTALPLVFGLAWHSAMDVVWRYARNNSVADVVNGAMAQFLATWEEEGLPAQLDLDQTLAYGTRTPAIAQEMLPNYIAQRQTYLKAELIAVEQPFAVPLPHTPQTWYIGRLDKTIRHEGRTIIFEHKTTSLYRKEGYFPYEYIEQWNSAPQIKGYEFGAELYYDTIGGVYVDAALCHKTVHEGFKVIPVRHNFDIIEEWLNDTEQWVERINRDTLLFEQYGRLTPGVFPKNEEHCYGKYGACSMVNICRTKAAVHKDEEPPMGYIVDHWEPFETLGLEKILSDEEL